MAPGAKPPRSWGIPKGDPNQEHSMMTTAISVRRQKRSFLLVACFPIGYCALDRPWEGGQYQYSGHNFRTCLAKIHDFFIQLSITAQQTDNYTARVRARRILELTGEDVGRKSFSKATSSNELMMNKKKYILFWVPA